MENAFLKKVTAFRQRTGEAAPRPAGPRLHKHHAHLQARGRHRPPAHRRGLAQPVPRHRPARPRDGRLLALESHGRRHAGIGQIARLRARKRHVLQDGAFVEWTRTNDARLSCNRTGNCLDNAVAESFFATLKNEMRYCSSFTPISRRRARRHRGHRDQLQPQATALHHRLPDTRECHGIILRANEARFKGAARGHLIPRTSVSEKLTQDNDGGTHKTVITRAILSEQQRWLPSAAFFVFLATSAGARLVSPHPSAQLLLYAILAGFL